MKYGHILSYVADTPWAILPEKMHEIMAVLAFRASGGTFSAEEINARIGDGLESPEPSRQGAIAVLPLRGVVAHRMGTMEESSGGMSVERFSRMYRAAVNDPNIASIIIDVDSPGGTVPGCHEVAQELLALRGQKRTVAVANSLMASAAYWIGCCADEIVATPSARVGSIGVFSVHADLTEKLEKEGIKVTMFKFGENKAEGEPFAPMSDAAKARRQASVDEAGRWFVGDVAKARGIAPSEVRAKYGDGAVFGAKEALAAGMIDRVATMDETIARLTAGRRSTSRMRAEGEPGELHAEADPLVDEARDADRARRLALL
jgi:signal peptide peptidase SppA